jgi:hypothetical protein
MLHFFSTWFGQKACELLGIFNNNLEISTHFILIWIRDAQTLSSIYLISTLQPFLYINKQGFGTVLELPVLEE